MIKIMDYSCTSSEEIFARGMSATGVEETVAAIIADIKENKDKALFKYCENLIIPLPIILRLLKKK